MTCCECKSDYPRSELFFNTRLCGCYTHDCTHGVCRKCCGPWWNKDDAESTIEWKEIDDDDE